MPNSIGLLSSRVKKVPSTEVDLTRYEFLDLENAEPDLGVPPIENGVPASDPQGLRKWLNFDLSYFTITSDDFITANLDRLVSIDAAQIITGDKTFTGQVNFAGEGGGTASALRADGVIETNGIVALNSEFFLVDSVATKINFGGAATDINIGSTSGTTTINNDLRVLGEVTLVGGQGFDGGYY